MRARSTARRQLVGPEPGAIAAYKAILKDYIDRRPAGLRARIAAAIGKHKSFVSQLTNPIYPVPLPARHIAAIVEICHFSPEERRTFLKAYELAHPVRTAGHALPGDSGAAARRKVLSLEIPLLRDARKQRALEALIRQFIERLAELMD